MLVCTLALLLLPASGNATERKTIAITVDDLPILATVPMSAEEVAAINARILESLKRHAVKAVGFVNEDRLPGHGKVDSDAAVLGAWLDAGMELGNHNFGHLGLWDSSLAAVEGAVLKGEVLTRQLTSARGLALRYYRPPFNQTGRDDGEMAAFEEFLHAHGYALAPFTIEHDDYFYSCVYDKLADGAAGKQDRTTIVAEYIAHLRESLAVFETMSSQLFERQVPQILLIHLTRLNADSLEQTLSTVHEMGYDFISLDEALRDKAYALPVRASKQYGPSWLARWARARGKKLSAYGQPDPRGRTAQLASAVCHD